MEPNIPSDAQQELEVTIRRLTRVGLPAPNAEEYVPTKDDVRHYASTHSRMPADWFDRWHRAELARAWDECMTAVDAACGGSHVGMVANPYRSAP